MTLIKENLNCSSRFAIVGALVAFIAYIFVDIQFPVAVGFLESRN